MVNPRLARLLTRLAVIGFAVIALLAPSALPVEASLPGKPFTQTQCEGYSDSVVRLYTAGLGREPEQDGFDFWINEYTSGRWSFRDMAAFFVESPEFAASYGTLDQDGFIRQIYRNVLGREGEAGGVDYWNSQMSAGVSRATVLMRFAESPENIAGTGTSQPTLGEFNEGRTGSWRCGPDMSAALLTEADFPAGWGSIGTSSSSRQAEGEFCQTLFWFPVESDVAAFLGPSGSYAAQAIHPYPTEAGSKGYISRVRDGVAQCGSYTANGFNVTMQPLNLPQYGDESVAVTISSVSTTSGTTTNSHLVVVRIGTVIDGIQLAGQSTPPIADFANYTDVATQRLTAFLNG